VLIIVEYRNLHPFAQFSLDIKAIGCLDVFKVDAPKGWLHGGDDVHQPVKIMLLVDLDIEHVNTCELLEQNAPCPP
jgi:hypothetical protein